MTETFNTYTVDGVTTHAVVTDAPEVTNEQILNHLIAIHDQNDRILAGLAEVFQIVGGTAQMLQSVQTVASQMNGPMGAIARKFMGGN